MNPTRSSLCNTTENLGIYLENDSSCASSSVQELCPTEVGIIDVIHQSYVHLRKRLKL